MRSVVTSLSRLALLALVAALPIGCAAPPTPASPFIGTWTTAEHDQITFRDDTVVITPTGAQPTTMGAEDCNGAFHLLLWPHEPPGAEQALAPHQPDLQRQAGERSWCSRTIRSPSVTCDQGGTTYVLLDDRDLLAIHRDRDVAGIERLSRL